MREGRQQLFLLRDLPDQRPPLRNFLPDLRAELLEALRIYDLQSSAVREIQVREVADEGDQYYGAKVAEDRHRGKNRKGAEGPMQFEPATFAEYAVRADRTARLTPYDPADAIFTAAKMLCANGVARGPAG